MIKLLKFLRGYAIICAIIAPIMMFVEVAMDLMQPKLMADIIDIGIKHHDTNFIVHTGGKMLIMAIIGFVGGSGCSIFAAIASMRMGENVRQGLFDKVQTLSFLELDRFKTSSLITRLTNDVSQVQNMMLMALRMMVRSPLLCIGGIAMAVILSPKLSLVFVAAIPFILIAVIIVVKKSYPLFGIVQSRIDKINVVMRENILGIRVIKAFNGFFRQTEKFDAANLDLMNSSIAAQNMNIILTPVVTLVMNFSIIAILWVGGLMVKTGDIEIGKIMAFINYLIQIMNSLMMVVNVVLNFSRASASADRINEVLESSPSVCNSDNAKPMKGYDIEFRNVGFKYNEHSENVLNDISFSIGEGERIGIIGATGSGKSSLISLIPRLYNPTEGSIFIGGIDVREIDIGELRNKIGVVLQEAILFSGTIEDNMRFGNNHAGLDEITAAAEDSQAGEFINQKQDGYKSLVEQRGKNLSGGQKQRVSIARTLLKSPYILIMDDSSSALDTATEAALQRAVTDRAKGKTIITIAQRISGVMEADKIIVLDNGKISGIGKHHELLQRNEIYRGIAISQLGEEVLING